MLLSIASTGLFAQPTDSDIPPFEPLAHSRTLVHDQTPAELLELADDIRADEAGNFYFAAATQTHPCWFISSDHGKVELDTIEQWGNNLFYGRFLYLKYPDHLYFKPFYGTKVYGPFKGHVHLQAFSNRNDENIGFMLMRNDSIFQYVNDSLVHGCHRLQAHTRNGHYPHWFTNNSAGDYAFFVRREGMDCLYRGGKLLDTAYEISDLRMYEDGTCAWSSRKKEGDITVTVRNDRGMETTISRPGIRHLTLRDSVYYMDDCSEVIMGTANIEVANFDGGFENYEESVTLAESQTFPPNGNHAITECPEIDSLNAQKYFAYIDGHKQPGLFSKIELPAIDEQGKYSFWNWKGGAYFAVINGKVETSPDLPVPDRQTQYKPIYLSPDGTERWHYAFHHAPRKPKTYEHLAPDTCQLIRNGKVIRQILTEERDYMVMRSGEYEFGRDPNLPWVKRAIPIRMYSDSYVLQEGQIHGPFPTPGFLNQDYFEGLPKKEQKAYKAMKYKHNHSASYPILEYDGLTDGTYYFVQDQGDQYLIVCNNQQLTLAKSAGVFVPNSCQLSPGHLSFLVRDQEKIYRYSCAAE